MNEEYAEQLNNVLLYSALTRQMASIGVSSFNKLNINQKLLEMAKECYSHHTAITRIIWDYMHSNAIAIDPQVEGVGTSADASTDIDAYNSLIQQIVDASSLSPADLANQIIQLVESTFQSAVKFTAISLKHQMDGMIDPLTGNYGILHTLALEQLSNSVLVNSLNHKNGLMLWPAKTGSDFSSLPLAQYDFSNPNIRYSHKSFIFMTFPNEDGSLQEGTKVTAPVEGTLISPDSLNATVMVREIALTWIRELRRDNEIQLKDTSQKSSIDDWGSGLQTPAPELPKSLKRRNVLSVVVLFVGIVLIFVIIAVSLQFHTPLASAGFIVVWMFVLFIITRMGN